MAVNILKTKDDVLKMRCGYCPRVIFRSDETDGEFKEADGKMICPICRIAKLSKMKEDILKDKGEYEKIQQAKEEKETKESRAEVVDIAVASQIRAGKKYRLKK